MLTVEVQGMAEVQRRLREAPGQIAFATSLAINRTLQDVRKAEVQAMRRSFDRPTPYTLKSLYIKPSTKTKLEGYVWFKDEGGKQLKAAQYLLPQVFGGTRPDKRFETLLRQAGYLPPRMQAVPASGAPLDRYGNVRAGTHQKILTALRASFDPRQNRSTSARSRRNARAARYFVSRGEHLPRGIWERFPGRRVVPVFLFTDPHRYRARFDFFGVGKRAAAASFERNARAAVSYALRTAR